MNRIRRISPKLISVVLVTSVFTILVSASLLVYEGQRNLLHEQKRSEVLRQLSDLRGHLEQALNNTFLVVRGLVSYVSINPNISRKEFDAYAIELMASSPHIRSVALAKGSTILYVYPLIGNESVLGVDLLEVAEQKANIEYMIEQGHTVISGPLKLIQGGNALINRTPIYSSSSEGSSYWGFASIPIYIDSIFSEAGLYALNSQLDLALRGADGLGAQGEAFWGKKEIFEDEKAELIDITIPGGSWQLAAIPKNGWYSQNPIWIIIIGLVLSFFLSLILGLLMISQDRLTKLNKENKEYLDLVDKYVITSQTDLQGRIQSVSTAMLKLCGYSKEELLGNTHAILRHPDTPSDTFQNLWAKLNKGQSWEGIIKNRSKDGQAYWLRSNINPRIKNGKITGYVELCKDISGEKLAENLAITDDLTGLFNRRYFNQIFKQERNRAQREKRNLSLLMLDVDCFKQYNDHYGHLEGDKVLMEVGKTLKRLPGRSSDLAFRLGGEEFGLIMSGMSREEAQRFSQRILDEVRHLHINHEYNTALPIITVSGGLFCANPEDLPSPEEMYHWADTALYEAKAQGRNRIVYSRGLKDPR